MEPPFGDAPVEPVLWPRTAVALPDLTDLTKCPACFTPLVHTRCEACGLDLSGPSAETLRLASIEADAALMRRAEIIHHIRVENAEAERARVAAAQQAAAAAHAAAAQAAHAAAKQREIAKWAEATQKAAAARAEAAQKAAAAKAEPAHEAEAAQAAAAAHEAAARPAMSNAEWDALLDGSPTPTTPETQAVEHDAGQPPRMPQTAEKSGAPTTPTVPASAVAPAPAPAARKYSSVQIILLIVGVSLVGVAAIFFLTVAWFVAGLVFRSIVVAAVTLSVFAASTLLRRRGLVSTAEGLGALGAILIGVDLLAVRANDLFGAQNADGLTYWGLSTLAAAGVLLGWFRLSRVRAASVVAFPAVPVGLGLTTAGVLGTSGAVGDAATGVFWGALVALCGAFLHRATWRASDLGIERASLLIAGGASALTALLAAPFALPDQDWAPVWLLGSLAFALAAHAVALVGWPESAAVGRDASRIAGALGGIALAGAIAIVALRVGEIEFALVAPLIAATIVCGTLDASARRFDGRALRQSAPAAALAAAIVGALLLWIPFIAAVQPLVALLTWPGGVWLDVHARPLIASEHSSLGLVALVVSYLVIGASSWVGGVRGAGWFTRIAERRRVPLLAAAAALALLAIPFVGARPLAVGLYLALAAAALGILLRPDVLATRYRPLAIWVGASSAALGWLTSLAMATTWLVASLAVAVALFALGRLRVRRAPSTARKTLFTILAASAVVIVAAQIPVAFTRAALRADPTDLPALVAASMLVACALGSLLVAIPNVRMLRSERIGLFIVFAVPAIGAGLLRAVVPGFASTADPTIHLTTAVALGCEIVALAAAGVWMLHPRNSELPVLRRIAAGLVAPLLWAMVFDALALAGIAPSALLAAVVATAVAAAAATVSLLRPRLDLRLEWEAGAGIVALGALVSALPDLEGLWLVLLVLAVGVLAAAIGQDGLFASRSHRRHLGWLALALATAGLWMRLAVTGATSPEPYVLPVSAALLAMAVLVWRADRGSSENPRTGATTLLTLSGLLVSAVPLALAGSVSAELRPAIVGGVGALLALGGAFPRRRAAGVRVLDALVGAGVITVVLVAADRGIALYPVSGLEFDLADLWMLGGLAVVLASGTLLLRPFTPRPEGAFPVPRWYGVLVSVAVIVTSVVDAAVQCTLALQGSGGIRTIVTVVVFSGLFVVAVAVARAPFGVSVTVAAIGLAAITAVVAVGAGAVDPIEWVTVPVGLALLATAVHLAGKSTLHERSRSAQAFWAVGLPIVLLPSTILGANDASLRSMLVLLLAAVLLCFTAVWSPRGLRPPQAFDLVSVIGGSSIIAIAALLRALGSPWVGGAPSVEFDLWLLAGAVLLASTGILGQRATRQLDARARVVARALLPAGFALIALPELFLVSDEPALRAILLVALSSAVAIGSAAALVLPRWRTTAAVLSGLALTTAIAVAVIRAAPVSDIRFEAWLLPVALTIIAVAGLLTHSAEQIGTGKQRVERVHFVATVLFAATVLAVGLAELNLVAQGEYAAVRAIVTVWVFAVLHAASAWVQKPPLTPEVAWIAFGSATLIAINALGAGWVTPIETLTVPLALALLADGALRLARAENTRSWLTLGPGVAALLVPSLLADFTSSPLWRVTALGILALLTLLIGLKWKLQAPFIIGAVVLIAHAVAQLWPWISAVYTAVPWWLWLGVGGALLIAVAARYEKRINDLRSVALSLKALR